jgi:hypothetical protein
LAKKSFSETKELAFGCTGVVTELEKEALLTDTDRFSQSLPTNPDEEVKSRVKEVHADCLVAALTSTCGKTSAPEVTGTTVDDDNSILDDCLEAAAESGLEETCALWSQSGLTPP